ncbi:MAG: pentapeptide repeat-containing protein [Oscillatoriales cyanobacterium]|nr:MAG: pentapeptide repeat-containing protein [Oscillatoriales cyanobacterium]
MLNCGRSTTLASHAQAGNCDGGAWQFDNQRHGQMSTATGSTAGRWRWAMALGALATGWAIAPVQSAPPPQIDPVVQLQAHNACRSCDLRYRDLTGLDLEGADLRSANLYGANLRGVNLQKADLRGANLGAVDGQRADLRGANLHRANLRSANLQAAQLDKIDLTRSNLMFVDFRGASLAGANLRDSQLVNIRSEGAELCGATMPNGTLVRQTCIEPKPEPNKL